MAAYITVGAKTTHGGTVITGSPQTTHYGIPIARQGDKVVCKKCKKVVTIITGDPSYIVDGAPVARAGDMTSCGSKLIAMQQAFSESGFDVGSIEPLQSVKSDMSNSFVEGNEADIEGSLIAGNTYVGDPDQGGGGGPWYEQDNRIAALYKESSQGVKDAMSSGMNKAGELKDRFINGTIGSAQAARDSLAEQYNIVKNGVTSLPEDTTAALLTTMRWQGKDVGADYVNFESGAGFRNFGIKGDISVNVHTGDVYVPEIANASVNNSKYPNAGFDLSYGRLTKNNGKSNANATSDLLSGKGNSTSVGAGVLSGSRDRTEDGKVKGGSLGPSVTVGYKQSKIGVSQSSTNMKLSPDYKLDPKTDRIVHIGKK